MARFLLVHGASHGAWCWRDVLPDLRALGHTARAIDLPGHGDDPTPPQDVTLAAYGHAIARALAEDGPCIVVGHSMGGYAITEAAEMAPDNISRLVYLCAYTPWPGLTLSEMRKLSAEQPLLPAIRMAGDKRSFAFDPEMAQRLFYHDCSPAAVAYALDRLTPQATAPSQTPVTVTARSADLPRSYIICAQDGAIPPDLQRQMAARFATRDVITLDSSHSPFFSMPGGLAACLHDIATQDHGHARHAI